MILVTWTMVLNGTPPPPPPPCRHPCPWHDGPWMTMPHHTYQWMNNIMKKTTRMLMMMMMGGLYDETSDHPCLFMTMVVCVCASWSKRGISRNTSRQIHFYQRRCLHVTTS